MTHIFVMLSIQLSYDIHVIVGFDLAMGSNPVTAFGNNTYKQEVTGSTIGIVGMGGIGLEVAKRAVGLKAKILYHNRNKRQV